MMLNIVIETCGTKETYFEFHDNTDPNWVLTENIRKRQIKYNLNQISYKYQFILV